MYGEDSKLTWVQMCCCSCSGPSSCVACVCVFGLRARFTDLNDILYIVHMFRVEDALCPSVLIYQTVTKEDQLEVKE